MKHTSIFSAAFLLFVALFTSQTAQAQQWLQDANNKNITTNATFNNTPGAKLGIGTAGPTIAKLEVQGAMGNTIASFRTGPDSRGVSLVGDWPGLFFNAYYNGASKTMAAGYAGVVNFDPNNGRIDFGVTAAAATTANATVELTPRMSINRSGNVAIGGQPAEKAKLVVQGSVGSTTALFGEGAQGISLSQNWPGVYFNAYFNGNGKVMAPGYAGVVNFDPNNGRIDFGVTSAAATTANAAVELTPRMSVNKNGNVLIGTGTDNGYKLAVNGSIRAKEIRVNTNWADYVFADDYTLRPLAEVEAFINANKHLPEMQSAAEIQEKGLDVAATATKMMAKIEELTLYLIDLKKENDALQTRVEQLESKQ